MTHEADMTAWPEIACQRGHGRHADRVVRVHVGGPTPYADYPPVPVRFGRTFAMFIYDWPTYQQDGLYCPAHDTVSETVDTLGVWEPCETTLVLAACSAADPASVFVDFGAQLGWFTLLAASCGLRSVCYEADPSNVAILQRSLAANGWQDRAHIVEGRVGPATPPLTLTGVDTHVAVAKLDVEGAEPDAIRVLWPAIEAGRVDNLLIEISPCFHDGYLDLVDRLLDVGYTMHPLPEKMPRPASFERFPRDLGPDLGAMGRGAVRLEVESWWQRNCWFTRPEAPW